MVTFSALELVVATERTKRILQLARETGALLTGEFTLASGKTSSHYFDGKRLTLDREGADLIACEVLDRLAGTDADAVGGLAMGAVPIVSAIAVVGNRTGSPIRSFYVRDTPKEHGTKRQIEGQFVEGSKVAIVDDVITTGGSVRRAIEAVEAAKCEVVRIVVVVDRHEGGSDELRKRYDVTAIVDLWPSGEAVVGESSGTAEEAGEGVLPQ